MICSSYCNTERSMNVRQLEKIIAVRLLTSGMWTIEWCFPEGLCIFHRHKWFISDSRDFWWCESERRKRELQSWAVGLLKKLPHSQDLSLLEVRGMSTLGSQQLRTLIPPGLLPPPSTGESMVIRWVLLTDFLPLRLLYSSPREVYVCVKERETNCAFTCESKWFQIIING